MSLPETKQYTVADLKTLMRFLRTPELGCPWDLKQSFKSIVGLTIEEAYEVVDAIETDDFDQLREELGDVFFHIIFYCQLADEQGLFCFDDVVNGVTKKLISRHPHVFPSGRLELRESVTNIDETSIKARWEEIKQQERAAKGLVGLLDDIPNALPALLRAEKIQKRAAKVGFDWSSADAVMDKVREEVSELQEAMTLKQREAVEEELGDVLFTLVNLSRHLKSDLETCLRNANRKFSERFRAMERQCEGLGTSLESLSNSELERLWESAKHDGDN